MATMGEVAEGLAKRCRGIPDLTCYPVMHTAPAAPALCVQGPVRWTYNETMDGTWRAVFALWVLVNSADLYRAQQALYTYLAPTGTMSVPAAVFQDPTLGLPNVEATVLGGSSPPTVQGDSGGRLLGCAVEVEVTAM